MSIRDEFWCHIINISDIMFSVYLHTMSDIMFSVYLHSMSDIMFSVYLHSMSDFELVHILLSGKPNYELPTGDIDEFRLQTVTHLYKMIKYYYK